MARGNWGVSSLSVALVAAALFAGCARTTPPDEPAGAELALSVCGNGACDTGESCASCPGDCGRCTQEHCGNDTCGRRETCVTCERDCGACSGCGNGVCEGAETCANCQADCGRCSAEFCGNGVCARRESCTACSRDCCPIVAQCAVASDCDPTGSECIEPTCVAGQCGTSNVANGTPVADQPVGDCLEVVCDGAGATMTVLNDSDLPPDDGNECTNTTCEGGSVTYLPEPAGTVCQGTQVCDGTGFCVECLGDQDCDPSGFECVSSVCLGGACGFSYTGSGQPTSVQTSGDCLVNVCDGMGGITSVADDMDTPNDGNECTADVCGMGVASNPPLMPGAPCMQNGGTACDGMGTCQ